jgi:hypothetical protein
LETDEEEQVKDYTLRDIQGFVYESMLVSAPWRSEAWRDCEMYDGDKQWTEEDWQKAIHAGIDPLTINRTFPIVNLLLGSETLNKNDITAEGRTQDDTEIGNVMTEGIKFIMDQYEGPNLVSQGFKDSIIPGVGFLAVGHNPDPRKEKIWLQYRDWKDMGWDPFGDPWLNPTACRYVYYQPWKDLETLIAMFPEKEDELMETFNEWSEWTTRGIMPYGATQDESMLIEEMKQRIAISSYSRKRVRPCEFWYVVYEEGMWAIFPNGDFREIRKDGNSSDNYQAILSAEELVKAVVPKIKTVTFLGNTILHWDYSPYKHDEYPFVPFYGYLDRFNYPLGVPRNIRGQNDEVNKRRSMMLAQLKSRRVVVEEGVVDDANKLQKLYEEAQKLDGYLVVKDGKMQSIKIEEMARLNPEQANIMQQSEKEIQEISGANADMLGYKSSQVSGVAIERKQMQGNMITAPLFANKSRSEKRLGALMIPEIQSQWKGQKILRIVDRITGAKKFTTLNQRIEGPMGEIQLKNNITQGKFDCVVSEAPATDTVRERYMEMLIEWVKKSPPEIIPYLMNTAMEISNLPNKEALMAKLQPLLGINPAEQDMSPEEIKQNVIKQLEAQQAEAARVKQLQDQEVGLKLVNLDLINKKIEAEIEKMKTDVKTKIDDQDLKGVKTGFDMQKSIIDGQHQKEMDKAAMSSEGKQGAIGGKRTAGGQR